MNTSPLDRRDFISTLSASVGALALAGCATLPKSTATAAAPKLKASPRAKLNIASIGNGGQGHGDLKNLETENIVALCDIDPVYSKKSMDRYPSARTYTDYREMLEKEKDVDAVHIATPDHTHAVIAMAAMRAGKHVYCQKPLTHDIREARELAKFAKESGLVTQMGTQGHSGEGIRMICEWIWQGAIGDVLAVDAWCSLSYFPPGHAGWSSKWNVRPTDTPPVPAGLNWDMWLGPAPKRPYHPAYHPAVWRCWWDFGNGMMGDRGAHTLDSAVWALHLGLPTSIEATSMGGNDDTHPLSAIVTYQFPERTRGVMPDYLVGVLPQRKLPAIKLTWYEGMRVPLPPEIGSPSLLPDHEGGVLFKGTKGVIVCGVYGNSPRIFPEERLKQVGKPAPMLPRVPKGNHYQDWINAIKEGRPTGADFAYAAPLTEICQLGNVAKKMNGRIEWDAANMKVTNLPDANKLIAPPYRTGWSL